MENSWAQVTSVLGVDVTSSDELPEDVMATGATPLNDKEQLSITWNVGLPPTAKVYPYMYFGELQNLRDNDTREFTVSLNGHDVVGPYSPVQGKTNLVAIREPVECDGGECLMKIVKTSTSTLPPLLNAIEAFSVIDFPQMETYEEDGMPIFTFLSLSNKCFACSVLILDIIKLYDGSCCYQEYSRYLWIE